MNNKKTTSNFITRATQVHNNKYNYDKSIYIGYDNKLIITCPIHGDFEQRAGAHLSGRGCPKCFYELSSKTQRLSKQEFIERADKVHNGKYDYSKVEYINARTKVCIICPIHGEFWVEPSNHLRGNNCPICASDSYKKVIYGVGINDTNNKNFQDNNAYKAWYRMIRRCYNTKIHNIHPTYKDCKVCDEWLTFSNFKQWFDNHYVEGWELDKDILVKGNKVYSPQTCCFVPQAINSLFTKCKAIRGKLPIGVLKIVDNSKITYVANVRQGEKRIRKYFKDVNSAFAFYKVAKEEYIKKIANEWKDQLEPRVYEAMCNYQVEIDD